MDTARNTCLHPEDYDVDPYEYDTEYYEMVDAKDPDPLEVPCPRCKGTGMDRWEEDECQECFGNGTVLSDPPNLRPIVKRI